MTKRGVVLSSGLAGGIVLLALALLLVPLPWRHADAKANAAGQRHATTRTAQAAGAAPGRASTAGSGSVSNGSAGLSTSPGASHQAGERIVFIAARSGDFAACEQRLKPASRTAPTAAILGASYTAGVGPDNSSLAWSVLLARELGWDAVIYGDSGAGYVSAGAGDRGPVLHMLARIGLRTLDPSLIVLQFGHDDIGVPAAIERRAVERTISDIRAQDPRARVALLTVFAMPKPGNHSAAWRTDRAIVSAARRADPHSIIIDPLARHWVYPRARHGLHPSAAGDRWIARNVFDVLRANGIRTARSGAGTTICDSPVGVPDGPGHPSIPGQPGVPGQHPGGHHHGDRSRAV